MGLIFKNKRSTRNTSDNNITISTSTDILFNIGKDLGEIKTSIENNNNRLDKIHKKLKEHNKRLERLENERQNIKGVKNNR